MPEYHAAGVIARRQRPAIVTPAAWHVTRRCRSASSSSSRRRRRGRSPATSGRDFVVESSRRPHPRPAGQRGRDPREVQERGVGAARRRRRARVRAALRRRPGQEEDGRAAEEAADGRRRAPARDGRRSRGRGDRLAPARGAEAEGSRAADGLPRDHARRDRAGARRDARGRRAARRRAGDAAHPRPALRLRGLAGALEEGHARALGGPRAVGRDAARRRARARADGVPRRRVVGHRGDLRSGVASTRGSSRVDGQRVATGRDFGPTASCAARRAAARRGRRRAGSPSGSRHRRSRSPASSEKPYVRRPSPPFMTSTLQQEASRKLRFSAQTTMRSRSASTRTATSPTCAPTRRRCRSRRSPPRARRRVELYGADYVPDAAASLRAQGRRTRRRRTRRSGPSGDRFRTPQDVRAELDRDEHALYELIWMRTIASQMKDARGQTVSLRIAGDVERAASGRVRRLRHGDHVPRLPRRVRGGPRRRPRRAGATRSAACRTSPRATRVELRALEPQGHETSPPARYTEATLVRTLEELGIGRPSTYASILGTILDRGYVFKRGTALVPAFLAFSVVGLLEQHFGRLVDYDFTAAMEDDLDRIAAGDEQRVEWLGRFYFGDGRRRAGCRSSSRTSARSTRARSTRSRSATGSSSASGATARTSSAASSARASPRSSRPTS